MLSSSPVLVPCPVSSSSSTRPLTAVSVTIVASRKSKSDKCSILPPCSTGSIQQLLLGSALLCSASVRVPTVASSFCLAFGFAPILTPFFFFFFFFFFYVLFKLWSPGGLLLCARQCPIAIIVITAPLLDLTFKDPTTSAVLLFGLNTFPTPFLSFFSLLFYSVSDALLATCLRSIQMGMALLPLSLVPCLLQLHLLFLLRNSRLDQLDYYHYYYYYVYFCSFYSGLHFLSFKLFNWHVRLHRMASPTLCGPESIDFGFKNLPLVTSAVEQVNSITLL